MKKKLLIISSVLLLFVCFTITGCKNNEKQTEVDDLKEIHAKNLEKSPFSKSKNLSKSERKKQGIPPNKYYEQEWELTMNPNLGRPTPENIFQIKEDLENKRRDELMLGRVPGDASDNNWTERGPNNVGGRSRAVLFDPNDPSDETVYAGGVSGGLWKNTNISNPNSVWSRVDVPDNLAVSCITVDPNDSNVFYIGTGESYVGGDVNGSGVWKSSDGGTTWQQIFGGITGETTFQSASTISVSSPAGVAGDYASYPTTAFGPSITSTITANIVLVDDGTGAPTEGCNALVNGSQISGNIALIRRANCNFTVKVKNAQNAGAVAVIMMNNVDGEPIPMGGADGTITIPSVMISKADGDLIETAVNSGTVIGSLNPANSDFTGNLVPGIQHINDIKVRNNNGVSEVYVAAADGYYGAANSITYLGGPQYGLYKSVDGGANWNELNMPLTTGGHKHCPNDIEIGADNKIWIATTESFLYGDGGGKVFSSTDGVNFIDTYTVADGERTQIAVSSTTPGKIFLLAELSTGGVTMKRTTNGFVPVFSTTNLTLPNDTDPNIPANDFPRQQAFYNLMLEVDPNNDQIVYTGGIDLFKSSLNGASWSQNSHWYGGFGYQYVHADQHGLAFGNANSNKVVYSNDGGVYYSGDGGTTISDRNNGFNVTQFYTVGVAPTTAFSGDEYFIAGAQDNGTQLFENANPGINSSSEAAGGDGAFSYFDQDGTDQYYITNYVYNNSVNLFNYASNQWVTLNNEGSNVGSFINPGALDSNLDILYANYTSASGVAIRRYAGIKSQATLVKTDLTNPLLDRTPTAFTVSPYTTTSTTLLVGTILGDIYKVQNANSASPTWTELVPGNEIVGSISDIEFGQSENEIFVTVHNYGVQNIWYTNDAGSTWQPKEGNLPDLPVKTIMQNPLNLEEVIVGTELGIWYTNDFSSTNPTWNSAFNGMSNVKVTDLDLRDDNVVFAATYGRGIFSGTFTADNLSVDEVKINENELTVFPTVSSGEVFVLSNKQLNNTYINVYSLSGQLVKSFNKDISNSKKTLNLTSLQSGVYLIKFSNGSFMTTKKIIIK